MPDSPSPPTDPLKPPTAPVKTYTATTLPENWEACDKEQKLLWLDTQPLPTDNTVSLGTLYRRGYNINAHFHFLYDALKDIRENFGTSCPADLRKSLIGFVNAFNAGFVSYGNALWEDIEHLLEDGTYGKNLTPLKSDLFENLNVSAEGASAPVVPLWMIISDNLNILMIAHDGLDDIRPNLASSSYYDLLAAVLRAGPRFIVPWRNKKTADKDPGVPAIENQYVSPKPFVPSGAASVPDFFARVRGESGSWECTTLMRIPELLEPPRALSLM